jgi:putative ABC transport system permease protein
MNLTLAIKIAFKALGKHKLRSTLTSLGIIIGVSSVIIMVGIGNSAKTVVQESISPFGANSMSVRVNKKPITEEDLKNIQSYFNYIKYISPHHLFPKLLTSYQGRHTRTTVVGVNNDYFKIRDLKIYAGRYFSKHELQNSESVVIIGYSIKEKLFPYSYPLRRLIHINGTPYRIIGVLKQLGQDLIGKDRDNFAAIPYRTTFNKILGSKKIHEMYLAADSPENAKRAVKDLDKYFNWKYRIPDLLRITQNTYESNVADDITRNLVLLIIGVASISLFVGGVGIMNIMLVSVGERTREIGIRMAIGAKRKDILKQFLIEAMTLSTMGGIIEFM